MNSTEAAELLDILHGSYPGTYFDVAIAERFANSFATNDYEASKAGVLAWTNTVDRFPTIAELNSFIRRLQGREVERAQERALPPGPEMGIDIDRAKEAFSSGYRQSRAKLGDDNETIDRKLDRLLRKFPGSVLGPFLGVDS